MRTRFTGSGRLGAVLLVGLAALAGCGDDDRPARWSYIHAAIVEPSCATASCHSERSAVVGVDLDDPDVAYRTLVGHGCEDDADDAGGRAFVDPGSPERSRLVHLLRGTAVPVPMPPDRLLTHRDVELVERWILEGATCD